jgi:PAS domain S-box-containing protein
MEPREDNIISDPLMREPPAPQNSQGEETSILEAQLMNRRFGTADVSPRKFFIITLAAIFLAEIMAMIVIYNFQSLPYWQETLLDGVFMILIIFPVVYYLLFQPLLLQIGERKRSEALLRKVLEILPVGVWITDPKGHIVQGNMESQQIWAGGHAGGIEPLSEYKGWWADSGKRVEPQEWAAARAISQRVTSLNEEINIEAFDGIRKTILHSALPILDEQDALQGAVVVNQDITQRRQMEKRLIQTNELLERFFLSINTLIAYMDRDFNFIRVNETYAGAGGNSPESFIGTNYFDLYPDEINQAIFRRVLETGEPYSVYEKPFLFAENHEKGMTYWDWGLQPVQGADGGVEGVVLSMVDVTERKLAERKLESQNQELQALSIAEGQQRKLAENLVQATITLNASLELDQVLISILEQIRKTFPFDGASVMLVEGSSLRVASFLGFEDHPGESPVIGECYALADYPLLVQVCSSLQPVNVDSGQVQPDWQMVAGMEWVHAYLAVPLLHSGEVIGIINLVSHLAGAFTPQAVDQLLAFAAPASLALHNARLFRAESTARQVAETLSTAAQALGQSLDFEQVVDTLLEHIQMIVTFETSGVTLLEDETRLVVHTMRGFGQWAGQDLIPSFPIDGITDSVVRRMISARRSIAIPNLVPLSPSELQSGLEPIRYWLLVPIIANDDVIGLVELGRVGDENFSAKQIQWAEALVGQAAVAIQNAWLFQQVSSSSDRLQYLARKLVEIQENERYHIAQELHDEAGQVLSSLKLNLGRLEQEPGCPPFIQQRLQELKSTVDSVLEELHRLAMHLRPVALDHLGLVAALEQYTKKLDTPQLSVQFKAMGFEERRLAPDMEIALYRIVQEALTNVVRHAQASSVGILLEWMGGKVKVFIEDDGIGFSQDLIVIQDRIGLIGMRERAEMLGGSLTIESFSGKGTSIIVEMPDGNTYSHRR